ncbi:hypothetical protein KP509_31G070500 [Ceratopteris richardii]|nr:hypothetical protein KP509_31G070500 [Ceratopteris richardii]
MNGTATSINPSLPLAGGAQIKQEINSVAPPGGFDLYEYGEVLKKAKGWGTNGTSEISNSRFQNNLSQHRDMPMASDNPYTWFKSNAEMTMNNVMGASQSSGNTRMAWQSGSQGFLDTIPTPATKYQCFPGDGVPSAQVPSTANTNAIPWNAVVTQLDGADNGLLNDSQRTNHAFAQDFSGNRDTLSTKDSLNRFNPLVTSIDTKDSSPLHSYSSVFRDFQADTPTQHEDMQILKFETFERWMGQEMGADGMLSSDSTWANVLAEDVPGLAQQMPVGMQTTASLLQEICFSITEFSPSCATLGFDTKVLVCGEFGVEVRDPSQVKWSCMFADIEVPAEVLQNGVLRCNVPSHPPGKVPFFVTRSDKIPCSEIKEFEFRAESKSSAETLEVDRFSKRHMLFQIRLARMLSNVSVPLRSLLSDQLDKDMISELTSLGLFGEWEDMEEQLTESGLGTNLREQYIQKLLKEKLQIWLLQKVLEGGKGAAVWDDNGLGVLHMGAALGYTWIIGPLLASGVNINFRDSRGWTALHWAAHCGREAMVIALLARGAAPGARTDPTNAFPGGQAPADLASAERHKGIAGYLAESSLTSHLSSLNLKSKSAQGLPIATDAVESASKMSIVQSSEGGPEVQLPLTLAAVRNATQAVARIQTEFRLESFRKKQESYQLEEDEYGISNEEAQYIVAAQKSGRGPSLYEDELSQVNAAIRIQQNYRGWKGRRNFLLFRQHVVKIQAHFRGHQVRKHYKKILWSVSIVEKAILRWRRKGRGLRGFGSIPLPENELGRNEEDDDFLKAGRKQIEASLEKALARVQSMVRSPEAQEQYRRLLEGYQKTKVHFEGNYDMLLTPGDKGHIFSEDYTMSTLR